MSRTRTGKPSKGANARSRVRPASTNSGLSTRETLIRESPDTIHAPLGHQFGRVQIQHSAPPTLQTKLTVNEPGDKYEQEADRVADQVMRMPEPTASEPVFPGSDSATNSMKPKSMIQRRGEAGSVGQAPPIVNEVLNSPGKPLDPKTRQSMESRFGHDFGQVKVHTDSRAADSAQAVDARAYTLGPDLVFGLGRFRPATIEGKRLIAHELTHVVQQRNEAGGIQSNQIQRKRQGPKEPFPEGIAYLDHLRKEQTIKGTGAARVIAASIVVNFWANGFPHFILSTPLKSLIIEELLNHLTMTKSEKLHGPYQEAITKLIEGTGKAELDAIFTRIVKKEVTKALSKPLLDRVEAHEKAVVTDPAPGAEVFSADRLLDLRDSFLANAQKPNKPKGGKPSSTWRRVCIDILERELARVYKGDKGEQDVKSAIKDSSTKINDPSGTELAPHSIENLMLRMSNGKLVVQKFTTDYERIDDPESKKAKVPTAKMKDSAWNWIIDKVGSQVGWHVFTGSAAHGLHSYTVFVENRPGDNIFLYYSDQNWTSVPKFLKKGSGSMAGFKRYHGESGFDRFLDLLTRELWDGGWERKEKAMRKADPKKKFTKDELYAKANMRTTLSLWKLARASKTSPFSVKGLPAKTDTGKSAESDTKKATRGAPFDYVIRPRDSLGEIAARYSTTIADIQTRNGMKPDETKIQAGKKLNILTPANTYIFITGDDLEQIAKKHKTTKERLMKLNNFKESDLSKIKHQDPIKVR